MYHLSMTPPFLDGNKRTVFAVMDTFLRLNGYRLNLSNDQAYQLVLDVVQKASSKENLCDYLEQQIELR